MNDTPSVSDPSREELRQRFLEHAAAAFELMFGPQHQNQLVTFDQREERACELGRDLTAWLLRTHTNADSQARRVDTRPAPCPRCQRPAQRVTTPDEPLPSRAVTSLAGEVTIERERWRCTTCRVVFFPPGSEAPAGDGGL
jgi:hypothetical protein